MKHRDEIVPILSEVFRTRRCGEWIALLESHDIPACRVNTLADILAHPQIEANGAVVEKTDARRGRIRTLGPPVKLSATPTGVARLAPALGEHTDEVLREFGLADAEVAALRAARVV